MRRYGLFIPIIILAILAATDAFRRISWNWLDEHPVLILVVLDSLLVISASIIFFSAIRINHNREDDCLTPPSGGDKWKQKLKR